MLGASEFPLKAQEVVWRLYVHVVRFAGGTREILEIRGYDHVCASLDGCGQHVAILGVVCHARDQIFMPSYYCLGEGFAHLRSRSVDSIVALLRHSVLNASRHLVENLISPTDLKDPCVRKAQEYIPLIGW